MSLPQSPPTTSGIVVLSGSNLFDPQSSDFPVIWGPIEEPDKSSLLAVRGRGGVDITDFFLSTAGGFSGTGKEQPTKEILEVRGSVATLDGLFLAVPPIAGTVQKGSTEQLGVLGVVLHSVDDAGITTTGVTTSGIVIVDIFPGAGTPAAPFVPPVVFNERFFPNFQGPFPEHDSRIYPRLPQFSTLTPGD